MYVYKRERDISFCDAEQVTSMYSANFSCWIFEIRVSFEPKTALPYSKIFRDF